MSSNLIDKLVKNAVLKSTEWPEISRMNLLKVVESAIDLNCVGGLVTCFNKASRFHCLLYRLAELHPGIDLILSMIHQDIHKYLRVFALVYLRLLSTKQTIYLNSTSLASMTRKLCVDIGDTDYRKVRIQTEGKFFISHVDEICVMLLQENKFCSLHLPTLR